jgi:hypothetical protein
MVNGKQKGNSYEREIANYLTYLLGVKYNRVPMSGAFATVSHVENPLFKGDVFTEDEEYKKIIIECKSWADMKLVEFFNLQSKIYDWIAQAKRESDGLPWLLFIKISRQGDFLIYDETYLASYTKFSHIVAKLTEVRKKWGVLGLYPTESLNDHIKLLKIEIPDYKKDKKKEEESKS